MPLQRCTIVVKSAAGPSGTYSGEDPSLLLGSSAGPRTGHQAPKFCGASGITMMPDLRSTCSEPGVSPPTRKPRLREVEYLGRVSAAASGRARTDTRSPGPESALGRSADPGRLQSQPLTPTPQGKSLEFPLEPPEWGAFKRPRKERLHCSFFTGSGISDPGSRKSGWPSVRD